ncbi:MAG: hypothetical protein HY812_03105 [Planctomycetes bacterium]|nr:hypothetical protein [Planctomycetota bacterium]
MKIGIAAVQLSLTVPLLVALVAAAGFAQPASLAAKQNKPQPRPPQGRTDPGRAGAATPRAAPPGPVHSCAEWEESEGVMAGRSEGRLGSQVPIRLSGNAGEQYVIYSSLFEDHEPTPFGLLRIRRQHGAIVAQGTLPPSGQVEVQLSMPSGSYHAGREIHLQALIGAALLPGSAHFTNRCIVEVVE